MKNKNCTNSIEAYSHRSGYSSISANVLTKLAMKLLMVKMLKGYCWVSEEVLADVEGDVYGVPFCLS